MVDLANCSSCSTWFMFMSPGRLATCTVTGLHNNIRDVLDRTTSIESVENRVALEDEPVVLSRSSWSVVHEASAAELMQLLDTAARKRGGCQRADIGGGQRRLLEYIVAIELGAGQRCVEHAATL